MKGVQLVLHLGITRWSNPKTNPIYWLLSRGTVGTIFTVFTVVWPGNEHTTSQSQGWESQWAGISFQSQWNTSLLALKYQSQWAGISEQNLVRTVTNTVGCLNFKRSQFCLIFNFTKHLKLKQNLHWSKWGRQKNKQNQYQENADLKLAATFWPTFDANQVELLVSYTAVHHQGATKKFHFCLFLCTPVFWQIVWVRKWLVPFSAA